MTAAGRLDYFADEAMRALLPWLVSLSVPGLPGAQVVKAPFYTESSVIDYATARPGRLTLNSLAVIHGENLSYITRARLESDLQGGRYPAALPEANVSVRVRGSAAPVEFASSKLIIFVVPGQAAPGAAEVQVVRQGVAGPKVRVELLADRPLIYPAEEGYLLARHGETGEWIEKSSPARPGEEVRLYAGGLGRLVPPLRDMQPPLARLPVEKAALFRASLEGVEVDRAAVLYVGSLAGYAGIYEIRLKLPETVPDDPVVSLCLDGAEGPVSLRLPVRRSSAQPESPVAR